MSCRGVVLAVGVCLLLLFLSLTPVGVQGRGKPGGGEPVWKSVAINRDCAIGSGYYYTTNLYNVDDDGDGFIDRALWYFESPVIRLQFPIGTGKSGWDIYDIVGPSRNIDQWLLQWVGYQATGHCQRSPLGGPYFWEIKVSPNSKYQKYPFTPSVILQGSLTIPTGQAVTLRLENDPTMIKHAYLQVPWDELSGTWEVGPVGGGGTYDSQFFGETYQTSAWMWTPHDFASDIALTGHPVSDPKYILAHKSLAIGWKGWECPSTYNEPHSTIGIAHDSAYPTEYWPYTAAMFRTFTVLDGTRCWLTV